MMSKKRKKKPYESQHHHPKFYLKGFVDNTHHIYLHRPNREVEKCGPKEACVIPWFYSVKDSETGERDNHIEIDVNGAIERAFSTILYQKVFKQQQLTEDEKLDLARALAYQAFRTPVARSAIVARYGKLSQRAAIAKLLKECPAAAKHADVSNFAEVPQDEDFMHRFALMKMFHISTAYTTSYFGKEWVFLRTDEDCPFITSDTSFAVDDPREPFAKTVNHRGAHTRVMIPLSSQFCLVIAKQLPIIGGHLRAKREEVEEINMKIAL